MIFSRDFCLNQRDSIGSSGQHFATDGAFRQRSMPTFVAKLCVSQCDLLPLLHDKELPPGITFANAEVLPGSYGFQKNLKLITAMKRAKIREGRVGDRERAEVCINYRDLHCNHF